MFSKVTHIDTLTCISKQSATFTTFTRVFTTLTLHLFYSRLFTSNPEQMRFIRHVSSLSRALTQPEWRGIIALPSPAHLLRSSHNSMAFWWILEHLLMLNKTPCTHYSEQRCSFLEKFVVIFEWFEFIPRITRQDQRLRSRILANRSGALGSGHAPFHLVVQSAPWNAVALRGAEVVVLWAC